MHELALDMIRVIKSFAGEENGLLSRLRYKREVQEFVLEVRENHDATVLLTTHDMEEADRLCDRLAIIDNGKNIAQGTPAGLKQLIRRNGDEPTLEEVFMELTGKTLKEEEDVLEE